MALTTTARVLSWTKKDTTFDESREDELQRCIASASALIPRVTGRQIERVTRALFVDGWECGGQFSEILYLPSKDRPVLHAGSDLVTVMENGVVLTVTTGYSTTNTVLVRDANRDMRCSLVRTAGYWIPGYQNISVGYKCGWTLDVAGDPLPMPEEIIQLASCIAWMTFQSPSWLGKMNVSSAGAAITISKELPPLEAATLLSLVIH